MDIRVEAEGVEGADGDVDAKIQSAVLKETVQNTMSVLQTMSFIQVTIYNEKADTLTIWFCNPIIH